MDNKPEKIVIQFVTTPDQFGNLLNYHFSKFSKIPSAQPIPSLLEEELLTIKQIAKFFQVSETTIHNWKNNGIIPYVRVNSRIRFKKSEILKLKEKQRQKRE